MEGNSVDSTKYRILHADTTGSRLSFDDEFEAWKRVLVPESATNAKGPASKFQKTAAAATKTGKDKGGGANLGATWKETSTAKVQSRHLQALPSDVVDPAKRSLNALHKAR